MEVLRAYKAVLDPNSEQLAALERHGGAARVAYNWALQEKRAVHQAYNLHLAELTYTTYAHLTPDAALAAAKKDLAAAKLYRIPTANSLSAKFTRWRGDEQTMTPGIAPWWRGINRHAFIAGMRNADDAWTNWLDSLAGRRKGRAMGYPRWKKKGRSRPSFAIFHDVKHPSIRVEDPRHLRIPNIGVVHLTSNLRRLWRRLRTQQAIIQSVRISRHGKRWIASVLVKETIPEPRTTRRQHAAGTVGVDLGVKHLATLSTGEHIPNPRHLRTAARRLTKAQRALSRTQRGSANRTKAARRVADLHAQLAERRQAYLHQVTKRLTTGWETVALEDLGVAGMTRSAKGTLDKPGRNVRQKAGLNREILDASFAEFRRQVTYKADWYGSHLALVNRFAPSSKTCSGCGAILATLTLSDRTFTCPDCGLVLDRDHNAARNIATLGRPQMPARPTPAPGTTTANRSTPDTSDEGDSRGVYRDARREPTVLVAAGSMTQEDHPPGWPPQNGQPSWDPIANPHQARQTT